MKIAKKRCEVCGKWYRPDARTWKIQTVCKDKHCRKVRKKQADKSWRVRHPGYEKTRCLKKQAWTNCIQDYWKTYRLEHPAYRLRDNCKRKARRKWVQNAARQDAIQEISVEKLASIPHYEPESAARQDTMDRRVDTVIEYLLWKERAARQDDIGMNTLHKP